MAIILYLQNYCHAYFYLNWKVQFQTITVLLSIFKEKK
jgi:hypothetical protein